jgi:hypothetical protein
MKSNVSDYLDIVQAIYLDACAKCFADVSDLRDLITIRSRVKQEGLSFLTITLPSFATDLERSLADGFIAPTAFRSFRKTGSIPSLLMGMTGLLFSLETGRIIDDQFSGHFGDHAVLIDSIRQICLAFKKIAFPCSPERVSRALTNFVDCEHANQLFSLPEEDQKNFSSVSSMLWDNSLGNLLLSESIPRHGPGATSERISGNQKFVWRRWYERLEPFYPVLGSAYSISAYGSREFDLVSLVKPEQEDPVRIVTVPKTLKSPRIIAIEPVCMQFVQQAIRELLYDAIESSRLTAGHVNFRDQKVNQELAILSSSTGQFATIDLSDASDRVPRKLALEMFRSNPDLLDAIDACRSTKAKMPDGQLIGPLNKFASMGSALCFPIESMYFYTLCVAALLKEQDLLVNHANVFKVSRDVYVYGDDIIVPCTMANAVLVYLQKYNCKVNASKTFVTGKFRESCGVDAYAGELVTPVYLRKQRPRDRHQASELISWVSTGNLFYKKGYWRTAALMFCTCESILGPLPYVSDKSSGLGRISYLGYRTVERWNRDLQHFEMKCWVPRSVYRSDSIDGYPALMKSLDTLERHDRDSPLARDAQHLERSALHGAVALTRRWVPSLS